MSIPEVSDNVSTPTSGHSPIDPPSGGAEPPSGGSPANGPVGEPAPAPQPVDFGDPDKWSWDSWEGDAYDGFHEKVRPWVAKAAERLRQKHQGTLTAKEEEAKRAREEADYNRRLWEAALREEDPNKFSDYERRIDNYKNISKKHLDENKRLSEELATLQKESAARYTNWFKTAYADKIASPEGKALLPKALDLGDEFDIEYHDAFELALMGEGALDMARNLLAAGNRPDLVREVVANRIEAARPKPPTPPRHSPAAEITNTGDNDGVSTTRVPKIDASGKKIDPFFSSIAELARDPRYRV